MSIEKNVLQILVLIRHMAVNIDDMLSFSVSELGSIYLHNESLLYQNDSKAGRIPGFH